MTNTNKQCQGKYVRVCVCVRTGRGVKSRLLSTCHQIDFNANKDVACLNKAKVNTEMEGADTVARPRSKGSPDDFSFAMFILLSVIVERMGFCPSQAGPL